MRFLLFRTVTIFLNILFHLQGIIAHASNDGHVQATCNMPDHVYTSSELRCILMLPATGISRLPADVWENINKLGICVTRQTQRGCRGGRSVKRDKPTGRRTGVNTKNLSHVKPIKKSGMLDFVVLNVRSARQKTDQINQYITQNDVDIMALTETWLTNNDRDRKWISALTPDGYKFINITRISRKGGGLAIIHKTNLSLKCTTDAHRFVSFEHIQCRLATNSLVVDIVILYRPPPSKKNKLTTAMFIHEFQDYLSQLTLSNNQIIIAGDINISWNDTNCSDTAKLKDTLDMLNVTQLVSQPTHILGNTLDWVITRKKHLAYMS